MPALLLRPTPRREGDSALVRVLEASIETLRAENEILRRRLAAAEARVARETANAEQARLDLPPSRNGSEREWPPLATAARGVLIGQPDDDRKHVVEGD
jgi:hypothetical protein